MNTILKLASRNIWRNKRRTLITAASIMFAVLFAIAINSFQQGAWDSTINGVVNAYFGRGQIHKKGYWEEKILDKAIPYTDNLVKEVTAHPNVTGVLPRIEGFALVASDHQTQARLIIGTDPVRENQLTHLADKLMEGAYLKPNDDGVLIADTLARELKLGVGDSLIFIGVGYHGASAAGKFPIRGLMKYAMPQMKEMIFTSLSNAQQFFGADDETTYEGDMITSLVLMTDRPSRIKKTVKALQANLDSERYEVMDWTELIPELIEAKELDTAGNQITLFILYLIIAFGIFGTILMMVKEREYEFGVLTAIGMQRGKLGMIVWLETLMIGFIGVLAGMAIAFPIVYYFYTNPIEVASMGEDMVKVYEDFGIPPNIPFTLKSSIFINQAIFVFFMLSIMALYPLVRIARLKPVEAMRS